MVFGIDVFVDCMTCEVHFGPLEENNIFNQNKFSFSQKGLIYIYIYIIYLNLYIVLQKFGISMIF